jgi:uncharacterized protein YceH (UPF0502 family)
MSRGAPSWVHKREMALRDAYHQSSQKQLEDRISQLEKENLELKKKVESLENGFLIALDLLTRNI